MSFLQPIARAAGAHLVEGKKVIEMMPAMAPDKGAALGRIASERGLRGIVYLGDDLSDIAAFREIAGRRENGLPGLCIAVRDSETRPEVSEAADLVLEGVAAAEMFLMRLVASLDPDKGGHE